jgi:hypothetical protein
MQERIGQRCSSPAAPIQPPTDGHLSPAHKPPSAFQAAGSHPPAPPHPIFAPPRWGQSPLRRCPAPPSLAAARQQPDARSSRPPSHSRPLPEAPPPPLSRLPVVGVRALPGAGATKRLADPLPRRSATPTAAPASLSTGRRLQIHVTPGRRGSPSSASGVARDCLAGCAAGTGDPLPRSSIYVSVRRSADHLTKINCSTRNKQ